MVEQEKGPAAVECEDEGLSGDAEIKTDWILQERSKHF